MCQETELINNFIGWTEFNTEIFTASLVVLPRAGLSLRNLGTNF